MIIERLEVGSFGENCYIVACEATKEGVVLDPGDEILRIVNKITELNIKVKYILLTHAHIDHVKEVSTFLEDIKAPVLMHKEDQFLLDSLKVQGAAFGLPVSETPTVDKYIEDGSFIEVGRHKFEVLHTPGHSPGSVTYISGNAAFVGDVLFAGSIGRTDLPGGNYEILINSIKSKLIPLGDDVLVYPGHGPSTTIGQEIKFNPFLNGL